MYNFENDIYRRLLNEVKNSKVISREEEQTLFIEYYENNLSETRKNIIKCKIITSNLKFALNVAKSYANNTNHDICDLYSEAKYGLLYAFDKYQYKLGMKFITFAVYQMRSFIGTYIENTDFIKIPTLKRNNLIKKLQEYETDELSANEYRLWQIYTGYTSLNNVIPDSDVTMMDTMIDETSIPSDTIYEDTEYISNVMETLRETLDSESYSVLTSIFGIDKECIDYKTIGADLGKSEAWVKNIKKRSLKKLKLCSGNKLKCNV